MYRLSKSRRRRKKKSRVKSFFLISAIVCFLLILLIHRLHLYHTRHYYNENKYNHLITSISKHHGLKPMLVKALIWRESRFNPNTVGSKGEIGLMQLMMNSSVKDWANHTKREIPPRGTLFNPKLNIEIGTWYLAKSKSHWNSYNNPDALALAEYNAGYSNVKKWIPKNYQGDDITSLIQFPSTKQYVQSILKKYEDYKNN